MKRMRVIITLILFSILLAGCGKEIEDIEIENDNGEIPIFDREAAIRKDIYTIKKLTFDIENGSWKEIKVLIQEERATNNTSEPIFKTFILDKVGNKYSYFQVKSELPFIPQIKENETCSTISAYYEKNEISEGRNYFEFKLNKMVIAPNTQYATSKETVTIPPYKTVISETFEISYEIEAPFICILKGEKTRFEMEVSGIWSGTALHTTTTITRIEK